MALVRMGTGPKKAAVGYELGFEVGDLERHGERGKADYLLIMDCTATVTNSSGGALSALNTAQQKAFLATHVLDMRWDGNKALQVNTQDADNPLHSYQQTEFNKLDRVGKRLIEKALAGRANTTTGLQQAIATGVNTWRYTAYVSLGVVQFLQLDSSSLFGVGPDMWRICRLMLKTTSDYLKTVNAGLTLTELSCLFSTLREKAPGSRICVPPMLRRYTPAAPNQEVKTTSGVVVLDAVDTAQPLASRTLGPLTVELGDDTVLEPPQTPEDVDAVYTYAPDVNSAVEGTISGEATPIVVYPNTRLAAIPPGALRAVQETYGQQWALEASLKPAMGARATISYLTRIAQEVLKDGQSAHFTNTAPIQGVELPSGTLSAAGVTMFGATDPEASAYPGLRMSNTGGGKVEYELSYTQEHLDKAAREYKAAQQDTSRNPAGNAAGMDAAVNQFAVWFPGTTDDEVKGFPSSANPREGGPVTTLYSLCRDAVRSRAEQLR